MHELTFFEYVIDKYIQLIVFCKWKIYRHGILKMIASYDKDKFKQTSACIF